MSQAPPGEPRSWTGADRVDENNAGSGEGSAEPLISLRWPARIAIAAVVFTTLVALASVPSVIALRSKTSDLLGSGNGRDYIEAADNYDWWAVPILISVIPPMIAFLVWFFRAYRNVKRRGLIEGRFKQGWSIGSWFVPFLNLIRPKQIMDEIWRGSAADSAEADEPVSSILHWWWGIWLCSWIVWRISSSMFGSAAEGGAADPQGVVDQINSALMLELLADAFDVVAAILAIVIILRVTDRFERIAATSGSAPVETAVQPAVT